MYITILRMIKIYKECISNNNEFDENDMINIMIMKKICKKLKITDKGKNKFICYHKLFHYLNSKLIKEDGIKKISWIFTRFIYESIIIKYKNKLNFFFITRKIPKQEKRRAIQDNQMRLL